jgi:uncharacterized membrane protein
MELWLVFGVLAYLSYAVSTSIDKYLMNRRFEVVRTDTFKMFFDGVVLLVIGLVFFGLDLTFGLVLWSLLLGFLYALTGIIYYTALKLRDVEEVVPFIQSSRILLIFVGGVVLLDEFVNAFNYVGVVLVLSGIYLVLSEDGLRFPRVGGSLALMVLFSIINAVYSLLVKRLLSDVEPINLAVLVYFSTTFILGVYQLLFRRRSLFSFSYFKVGLPKILVASFFGAMGTFLLYSALKLGNASKVYPVAGLESVFIFIIASVFLKERFYWHRLFGILVVCVGIFFVSI